MANVNQRRGSTRTAGLAVSAVVALGFVAMVGFFYLRGRAGVPVNAGAQTIRGEAPPDIRAGVPGQAIGAGRGMEVTLVDRGDPSRVSMRIISESSEPRENARYIVQRPRGYIYARDGRAYHVSADTGVLHIPNTQMRPESATLEGNVVIRVFEGQAPGARFDPDDPAVSMMARFDTQSIQYDGTLGEVTTPDPFTVTTEKARFWAVGLRGIFNQEQDRLEYGEIHRDGHLVYVTSGDDPLRPKPSKPPAPTGRPGSPPAPKPPPVETFYVASLTGGVVVTRGSQSIESDALDGWIRLVDNKLADNAVAPAPVRAGLSPGRPVGTEAPAPRAALGETASGSVAGGVADGFESAGLDSLAWSSGDAASRSTVEHPLGDGDSGSSGSDRVGSADSATDGTSSDVIDVRWTGAMVVRVSEHRPSELGTDQVAVRFTTGPDSLCLFRDHAAGATGTASTIDYAATSRVLRLESLAPGGVHLRAAGAGHAVCSSLSVQLGAGVATVSGPGSLRDRTDRYLVWNEQAEFQFKIDDGGMTSLIEHARVLGNVGAVQGESRLSGSELSASFVTSGERSNIHKLTVLNEARAVDGSGGELNSAELDVFFDAPAGSEASFPSMIDARGGVLGQKDGSMLEAQSVRVVLEPDGKGRPEATSVAAIGSARFVRAKERDEGRVDLVDARSEEILAELGAQIVELIGPGSTVANLSSSVTGSAIRIDGLRRYVDVFGQGRFEHRGRAVDSESTSDAMVTWTRHVFYDDELGIVECEGSVVASNQPDAFTVQTLRADRARLMLEPRIEGLSEHAGSAPRQLQRAYAWGSTGDVRRPAQVEMREYPSPYAAGRERPSRVAFLEGDHVIADDVEGTLRVPGEGRAFFSDRRRHDEGIRTDPGRVPGDPATSSSNPFGGRFERGDSRFQWRDSMVVDRRTGFVTLTGKSNLRHVRLTDGLPTDIEADTIVGRFRNMQVSEADRRDLELRAEFLGADAMGNVWIRSTDHKELLADRVEYDAEAGIAKAIANTGNSVVYFDPAQGIPQRAAVLYWDQANNRIEIREAGTIVVPR